MSRLDEAVEVFDVAAFIEQYEDVKVGGVDEVRVHECPKCGNENFKLYVNPVRRVWFCYICGWGRGQHDVCVLLAAIAQRSLHSVRIEILQSVAPAPTGDIGELLQQPQQQEPEPRKTIVLPGSDNFTSVVGAQVWKYAQYRGLSATDVRDLCLRAATSIKTGTPTKTHRGPYLVFPVFCEGEAVACQGRNITARKPKCVSVGDIGQWLWPQDDLRFQSFRQVAVVEGPMDVLGLRRVVLLVGSGYIVRCTWGKKLSDRQFVQLCELRPDNVLFMWDGDARKEVQRAVERVAYAFPAVHVADLSTPKGVPKIDPGDALNNSRVIPWLWERMRTAMNVGSPEYLEWQLKGDYA